MKEAILAILESKQIREISISTILQTFAESECLYPLLDIITSNEGVNSIKATACLLDLLESFSGMKQKIECEVAWTRLILAFKEDLNDQTQIESLSLSIAALIQAFPQILSINSKEFFPFLISNRKENQLKGLTLLASILTTHSFDLLKQQLLRKYLNIDENPTQDVLFNRKRKEEWNDAISTVRINEEEPLLSTIQQLFQSSMSQQSDSYYKEKLFVSFVLLSCRSEASVQQKRQLVQFTFQCITQFYEFFKTNRNFLKQYLTLIQVFPLPQLLVEGKKVILRLVASLLRLYFAKENDFNYQITPKETEQLLSTRQDILRFSSKFFRAIMEDDLTKESNYIRELIDCMFAICESSVINPFSQKELESRQSQCYTKIILSEKLMLDLSTGIEDLAQDGNSVFIIALIIKQAMKYFNDSTELNIPGIYSSYNMFQYISKISSESIQPMLPKIMKQLSTHLENSKLFLYAMQFLLHLAEAAINYITPYHESYIPILIEFLLKKKGSNCPVIASDTGMNLINGFMIKIFQQISYSEDFDLYIYIAPLFKAYLVIYDKLEVTQENQNRSSQVQNILNSLLGRQNVESYLAPYIVEIQEVIMKKYEESISKGTETYHLYCIGRLIKLVSNSKVDQETKTQLINKIKNLMITYAKRIQAGEYVNSISDRANLYSFFYNIPFACLEKDSCVDQIFFLLLNSILADCKLNTEMEKMIYNKSNAEGGAELGNTHNIQEHDSNDDPEEDSMDFENPALPNEEEMLEEIIAGVALQDSEEQSPNSDSFESASDDDEDEEEEDNEDDFESVEEDEDDDDDKEVEDEEDEFEDIDDEDDSIKQTETKDESKIEEQVKQSVNQTIKQQIPNKSLDQEKEQQQNQVNPVAIKNDLQQSNTVLQDPSAPIKQEKEEVQPPKQSEQQQPIEIEKAHESDLPNIQDEYEFQIDEENSSDDPIFNLNEDEESYEDLHEMINFPDNQQNHEEYGAQNNESGEEDDDDDHDDDENEQNDNGQEVIEYYEQKNIKNVEVKDNALFLLSELMEHSPWIAIEYTKFDIMKILLNITSNSFEASELVLFAFQTLGSMVIAIQKYYLTKAIENPKQEKQIMMTMKMELKAVIEQKISIFLTYVHVADEDITSELLIKLTNLLFKLDPKVKQMFFVPFYNAILKNIHKTINFLSVGLLENQMDCIKQLFKVSPERMDQTFKPLIMGLVHRIHNPNQKEDNIASKLMMQSLIGYCSHFMKYNPQVVFPLVHPQVYQMICHLSFDDQEGRLRNIFAYLNVSCRFGFDLIPKDHLMKIFDVLKQLTQSTKSDIADLKATIENLNIVFALLAAKIGKNTLAADLDLYPFHCLLDSIPFTDDFPEMKRVLSVLEFIIEKNLSSLIQRYLTNIVQSLTLIANEPLRYRIKDEKQYNCLALFEEISKQFPESLSIAKRLIESDENNTFKDKSYLIQQLSLDRQIQDK